MEETLRRELGSELKTNVSLKPYVSFGVGGVADYFYIAEKIDDLVKAVSVAYKNDIPYLVIGGGYNILPSDSGFPGLVIKNQCSNVAFSEDTSQVIVDSGLTLAKLINIAAGKELGGLEFLFGVPGTVGGAVYGNAGAFSYEIGDFVKSLIILLPQDGKMTIVKKTPDWMSFSYRSSKLKHNFGAEKFKPVILTVKLQLVRRRRDEILGMMQTNLAKKNMLQPLAEKSAGSFFKNIDQTPEHSAGFLLDKVGAKKLKVGGAMISKKHANFIVNQKNATASDIRHLADKAREMVKEKFGLELEEEIEYVGKW